jgi:hypothetical protein
VDRALVEVRMPQIGFVFNKPTDVIGDIVVWRTKDPYSHSAIIIGDTIFSSEIPQVKTYQIGEYNRPIHEEIWFTVTPAEFEHCLNHAKRSTERGWYNFIALGAWIIGLKEIKAVGDHYCHEFCRFFLVSMGLLNHTNELITARRLIDEIQRLEKMRMQEYATHLTHD